MGFLDKLFNNKPSINISTSVSSKVQQAIPKSNTNKSSFHKRGVADSEGLYPSELVMLYVANKYKTNDTNFPKYLTTTYEIANPPKMINDLQNRGYLCVGSAKDILPAFKMPELKELASSLGMATTGKKADIIDRLSAASEEQLSVYVKERPWKLTEKGQQALKANPYIAYFLDKHSYNVTEVGVDIWSVNKAFLEDPKRPYRDVIYRQLNDRMNEANLAIHKNPRSGSHNPHIFCECRRMIGLFIEEEGKSYINASDSYFQYIFMRINVEAAMDLKLSYSLFSGDKKRQKEVIETFYDKIMLYPFQRDELLRLIDEADIPDDRVRESLIASFNRAKVKGIMTPEVAADFIVLELSGESDKARDMAIQVAKKSAK